MRDMDKYIESGVSKSASEGHFGIDEMDLDGNCDIQASVRCKISGRHKGSGPKRQSANPRSGHIQRLLSCSIDAYSNCFMHCCGGDNEPASSSNGVLLRIFYLSRSGSRDSAPRIGRDLRWDYKCALSTRFRVPQVARQ